MKVGFAIAAGVLVTSGLLMSQVETRITVILTNGKIWTGNAAQAEAEAIAIRGNRIAAVGPDTEVLRLKEDRTPVFNLQGRRVVPGFNDAHVHFVQGGMSLAGPQLRYSRSQQEFRDTLAIYARRQPKGQWITNGEWDHENWSPAELPAAALIDPVTQDWPVYVERLDGHMGLANSLAMRLAHVERSTKDVAGGVIVRDAEGNPTGIFKDAAQSLIEHAIPPESPSQIRDAVRAAQMFALRNGVTSVQDMSAAPRYFSVYEQMQQDGELHLRISGHQPLQSWERLATVGLRADFGNEYLHIGAVKGFADGSLGSTTALMFAPYLDSPNTSGIASAELSNPAQMQKNIEDADAAGLQIAVHAIGDKANNTILNFYAKIAKERGERARRWRIEHAQHLLASDIPRFAELKVVASMQPYHCIDDGRWAEKRIGAERAKTTYAFRSLIDTGATLVFGSDWPVAPMVPIMGIYGAVTRRTLDGKHPEGWVPEQKINVAEAVKAYTAGSAYASFDDKVKGKIEPGMLADFVVLTDDIFNIDPVKIADTKVWLTFFDGKLFSDDQRLLERLPSGLLLRPSEPLPSGK